MNPSNENDKCRATDPLRMHQMMKKIVWSRIKRALTFFIINHGKVAITHNLHPSQFQNHSICQAQKLRSFAANQGKGSVSKGPENSFSEFPPPFRVVSSNVSRSRFHIMPTRELPSKVEQVERPP